MNWKFNYWTILFLLSFVFTLYKTQFQQSAISSTTTTSIKKCESKDIISPGEALKRIRAHHDAMKAIKKQLEEDKYDIPVSNFVMDYAQLPRHELNEMLCHFPQGDVFAYPVIETDPQDSTKQLFSIIFSDQKVDSGQPDFIDALFFDFTKPCPPCRSDDILTSTNN